MEPTTWTRICICILACSNTYPHLHALRLPDAGRTQGLPQVISPELLDKSNNSKLDAGIARVLPQVIPTEFFDNEDVPSSKLSAFARRREDPSSKAHSLVISVVNDYAFEVFLYSMGDLLKNKSFMDTHVLFCTDDEAMRKCHELISEPRGCVRTLLTYARQSDFGKGDFRSIGWLKIKMLQELFADPHIDQVAIFDTDVAFFSAPQWLDDGVEFMYQLGTKGDINIGQMLWRNTKATKLILPELLKHTWEWDQAAFNKMLPGSTLKLKPLDVNRYRSHCYGYGTDAAHLVTYHANCVTGSTNKLSVLKDAKAFVSN